MSPNINILEGAFIISDAHFSEKRPEFFSFIEAIYNKQLEPSQIILMGDIFDALFGAIEYTYKKNKKLIDMINSISHRVNILYLEGNHDFNLQNYFPNIIVIPISQQPVNARYKDKIVYLAHGDFDGNFGYKLYTSLVRNVLVLNVLKIVDNLSGHAILNYIDNYLNKKNDCNEFNGFSNFIKNRLLGKYKFDYFIEGHFHQNKIIKLNNSIYINLAAFACNQRYFIVNSLEDKELLEENIFSKGI